MRVVSLLPSATEIVFALGRGNELVGVTFECDYPPEARTRRVVSTSTLPEGLTPAEIDAVVSERIAAGVDLYRLDEGALAEIDADVVLTQDLCKVCAVDLDRVDDALAYLGCAADVITLDPHNLDDVIDSIATIGRALDAQEQGRNVVDTLRARMVALGSALDGASRRPVLTLEWTDPAFTAGHWVPDLVAAGGGVELLGRSGAESQPASWDDVIATPAEVVLVAPCGYHLDDSVALAEAVVAAGHVPHPAEVWAVDADSYFVRPGPRVIDGAELVANILHPERTGEPDPTRARQIPAP